MRNDEQISASTCDVMVFAEDPGAANFVAALPALLLKKGHTVLVFTSGSATQYLRDRGQTTSVVASADEVAGALDSVRPNIAVVGTALNPDTPGLAMIDACRKRGIPSIGVVDTRANAGIRFRGRSNDPLAHAPDSLLVPDQQTRDAFVALGYPLSRISVCGHPHYDDVRSAGASLALQDRHAMRQRLFPGLREPRPVVVFIAEPFGPEEHRSADYTLSGRGGNDRRNDIVIEEFLDAVRSIEPAPYAVLRLHPKNSPEEFQAYAHEFDLVSSGGRPLEMLFASDLNVGMTSMLLLESALMGRTSLAVLPRLIERSWMPAPADGVIPCALTRSELREQFPRLLLGGKPVMVPGIVPNAQENMVAFVRNLLTRGNPLDRVEEHGGISRS